MRSVTAAVTSLLVAALFSLPLQAEPTAAEKETARTLMDEGDELVAQGDREQALARYRAAHEIMNVPTTGLEVAKVQASLGRLVEARTTALSVVRMQVVAGEPAVFARARSDAQQLAEELVTRIPSVQIQVEPADAPQLLVKIDGTDVPVAAIGLPYKINPGAHRALANAQGFAESGQDFTIAEGEAQTVTLTLVPSATQPVATQAAEPPPPPVTYETTPSDTGGSSDTGSSNAKGSSNVVAYIALGISGVSAGVGAITGLGSIQAKNDADEFCKGNICSPDAQEHIDNSKALANVANVSFGIGIAAGVFGVWQLLSSPSSDTATAETGRQWQLSVETRGNHGAMVGVHGAL